MLSTIEGVLARCAGTGEYVDQAESWEPGRAFPVLAGEPLDRYEALFDAPPAVEVEYRAGTVLSTGGEVARAAGFLLAAATARPHRHVLPRLLIKEIAGCGDEPVAVVALADDLTEAGDWPGSGGGVVGVLTARGPEALSCLIYRTLTHALVPAGRTGADALVAAHPLLPIGSDADVVEFDDLARLRDRYVPTLMMAGLGRECSLAFPDGIVCGRSDVVDDRPVPTRPGLRLMPCLHGGGCFRMDLADDQRLPAKEIRAGLVFTHSCSSLAVGVNAFPAHVSLALGLIDGTAVAVIGVRGVHLAQRDASAEIAAAMADRLPLGEVVRRLEARSRPLGGVFQSFGLIGDPAMVLRPPGNAATHPALRPSEATVDVAAADRLARLDQVILPRLERLRLLQVDFGDPDGLLALRRRVDAVVADLLGPDLAGRVSELEDAVAGLQYAAVARMADRIYVRGWDFAGIMMSGLTQVAAIDDTCPACAQPLATRVTLAHRVAADLRLTTLQCRRCGDVWWSTGDSTLSLEGPLDLPVRRAEPAVLPRTLVNAGPDRARGAAAVTYRIRKQFNLPEPSTVACAVPPDSVQELEFPLDLRDRDVRPDTHVTLVVALVDGVLIQSYAMMGLS